MIWIMKNVKAIDLNYSGIESHFTDLKYLYK